MQTKKRNRKNEALTRKKKALLIYKLTGVKIKRETTGGGRSRGVSDADIKNYLSNSKLGKLHYNTLNKLVKVSPLLRTGSSITETAKLVKLPRKTLKKAGISFGLLEKDATGKTKALRRFVRIYAKNLGEVHNVEVSAQTASIVGRWWHQLSDLHGDAGKQKEFKKFQPKTFKDVNGKTFTLETDYENLALMGAFNNTYLDDKGEAHEKEFYTLATA